MIKPHWFNKRIDFSLLKHVQKIRKDLKLHTVCEEAKCPNISECFSRNTATFMLLGDVCTRGCRFCAIKKGRPLAPYDEEPKNVAKAIEKLGIKFVVLTSVCRDDLDDKGVAWFVRTIEHIRKISSSIRIETLIPDFCAQTRLFKKLIAQRPDIISHNLETVQRLYGTLRPQAGYKRSLEVLALIKEIDPAIPTKSAIMLGLGESRLEVIKSFSDLREVGCNFLSIGQYLRPSSRHFPVKEYITPAQFNEYKEKALSLGFDYVVSSAYARSSYMASSYFSRH